MASKKKGLSMDEKGNKIEEWFVEHPHPYLLKELMALIPKAKGVIPQSIEEVLEVLVSEDRITCDRLGISNLYWKFQSTGTGGSSANGAGGRGSNRRTFEQEAKVLSAEELTVRIASLEEGIASANVAVSERQQVIETDEERAAADEDIKALRSAIAATAAKCDDFADRDPLVAEKLRAASLVALDAANRWTDNIFLLEQYVTKRMHASITTKEFRLQFELPEELDYVSPTL